MCREWRFSPNELLDFHYVEFEDSTLTAEVWLFNDDINIVAHICEEMTEKNFREQIRKHIAECEKYYTAEYYEDNEDSRTAKAIDLKTNKPLE